MKRIITIIVATILTTAAIAQTKRTMISDSIPEIESEDFHINSENWEIIVMTAIICNSPQKVIVAVNTTHDVWEYRRGFPKEFIGKQVFTELAARRETKKANKEIAEFWSFSKQIINNTLADTIIKKCNIQKTGYLDLKENKIRGVGILFMWRWLDGTLLYVGDQPEYGKISKGTKERYACSIRCKRK